MRFFLASAPLIIVLMDFRTDAAVERWDARVEDWFFAVLPVEVGAQIAEIPRPRSGFGAVRVEATIGVTTWRTSIFPDAERATYVLPLKRAVREAEGIEGAGAIVSVVLVVLG